MRDCANRLRNDPRPIIERRQGESNLSAGAACQKQCGPKHFGCRAQSLAIIAAMIWRGSACSNPPAPAVCGAVGRRHLRLVDHVLVAQDAGPREIVEHLLNRRPGTVDRRIFQLDHRARLVLRTARRGCKSESPPAAGPASTKSVRRAKNWRRLFAFSDVRFQPNLVFAASGGVTIRMK